MKTITCYEEHNLTLENMYQYLYRGALEQWKLLTDEEKQWAFDYIQEVFFCEEYPSFEKINEFIEFDLPEIWEDMKSEND